MAARRFNMPLSGLIEPYDAAWEAATPGLRLAFYVKAGEIAKRVHRAQMAEAIGADGEEMRPRKRRRPDGADGPVMTPHGIESRTNRLLDYRAWSHGLTLFWHSGIRSDQRLPWAQILSFHAAGLVVGGTRRDVRLSHRSLAQIRLEAVAWWKGGGRDVAMPPEPAPALAVFPAPPAAAARPAKAARPVAAKRTPLPRGRVDLQNSTGGIGASDEVVRRAIEAGTSTGFHENWKRKRRAGTYGAFAVKAR